MEPQTKRKEPMKVTVHIDEAACLAYGDPSGPCLEALAEPVGESSNSARPRTLLSSGVVAPPTGMTLHTKGQRRAP